VRVVRHVLDPLVHGAFTTATERTSFDLEQARSLITRHCEKRINVRGTANGGGGGGGSHFSPRYCQLLARAYLLVTTNAALFIQPADSAIWKCDDFICAFRETLERLLERQSFPTDNNVDLLRSTNVSARTIIDDVMRRAEEQRANDGGRQVRMALRYCDRLLALLNRGLPPVAIVRRFIGGEEATRYEQHLETLAAHSVGAALLDMDGARMRGASSLRYRRRSWDRGDTRRVVTLLAILAAAVVNGEATNGEATNGVGGGEATTMLRCYIGEAYARYRRRVAIIN
jgi:hypothetical protein